MSARYALYLAPEIDTPLWRFGSDWLGYDAATGETIAEATLPTLAMADQFAATAQPRLYGFHMTLKAPFRLADGKTPDDLDALAAELAKRHAPFGPVPLALMLRPAEAGSVFAALCPAESAPALAALERDAVAALEPCRARLTPAEIARRKPERLSRRQLSYLENYGYPYVFEEFSPHFSLTGTLDATDPTLSALAAFLADKPELKAFTCQSLVLFEQPEAGERFVIRKRFPLG